MFSELRYDRKGPAGLSVAHNILPALSLVTVIAFSGCTAWQRIAVATIICRQISAGELKRVFVRFKRAGEALKVGLSMA